MEGLSGRGRDWVLGVRGWVLGTRNGKIPDVTSGASDEQQPAATARWAGRTRRESFSRWTCRVCRSPFGDSGNKA